MQSPATLLTPFSRSVHNKNDELSHNDHQNGDENSIINWIYDGDRLKTGDEDDEIVTVEDVKRKMEMLHLNR